jgi:Cu-Zn family superoxide dismutase
MHRFAMIVLFTLAACKGKAESTTPAATGAEATASEDGAHATADDGAHATAQLEARSGSSVTGTVTFHAVDGGVEVTATVDGLAPGDHGYHVHEKGDCSAPDATSAGGHFNPDGQPHGAPDAAAHHAGDFGNLTAGADGKASKTFVMRGATLAEGASSLVGKGFIVHEKADDLTTQPTGNAGARVACGVILLDAQ